MRFSTIAAFVTSLAVVSAQAPDLSAIPECAVTCLVAAISDSGCGVTDVTCQCTTGQQTITSSLESCVPSRCSAEEVAQVVPALTGICSAAGFSVSVPSSYATAAPSAAGSAASSVAASVSGAISSLAASGSSRAASATSSAVAESTGGAVANVAGLGAVALGMFAAIL